MNALTHAHQFLLCLSVYLFPQASEARALKIEWAAHFSGNKFTTTFEFVAQTSVPSSHNMVFYYTSLRQAKHCVATNTLPGDASRGGLVIHLQGPQVVTAGHSSLEAMGPLAESREAVIVLSLPHSMLFSLGDSDPRCKVCAWISFVALSTLARSLSISLAP